MAVEKAIPLGTPQSRIQNLTKKIRYYLLLKKGVILYMNKIETPSPKNALF